MKYPEALEWATRTLTDGIASCEAMLDEPTSDAKRITAMAAQASERMVELCMLFGSGQVQLSKMFALCHVLLRLAAVGQMQDHDRKEAINNLLQKAGIQ